MIFFNWEASLEKQEEEKGWGNVSTIKFVHHEDWDIESAEISYAIPAYLTSRLTKHLHCLACGLRPCRCPSTLHNETKIIINKRPFSVPSFYPD